MVSVVALDEVLHNRAALKQTDELAVGKGVGQGRDAAIGVDLEEPWLLQNARRKSIYPHITILRLGYLLLVLAEVDLGKLETQPSIRAELPRWDGRSPAPCNRDQAPPTRWKS